MRLIIAGSRHYPDWQAEKMVRAAMKGWCARHGAPTAIISGGAPGIDTAGGKWASANGWRSTAGIPLFSFPADWDAHGKKAGPLRNAKMAANADALLLIWDGKSKGSASMKREAEKAGLHITEVIVEEDKP